MVSNRSEVVETLITVLADVGDRACRRIHKGKRSDWSGGGTMVFAAAPALPTVSGIYGPTDLELSTPGPVATGRL